jgi:hypothetical protein
VSVPVDPVAEIRRLYFAATKQTILRDLDRAIDLLKTLGSDDERQRAAVFMEGLAQMRAEWGVRAPDSAGPGAPARPRRRRPPI